MGRSNIRRPRGFPAASLALLLAGLLPQRCRSVLPTASVDIFDPTTGETRTILASQASFGSYPPMTPSKNPVRTVRLPPQNDALLCGEASGTADYSGGGATNDAGTVMLVPRGTCTFERKALSAQRLGASAVIVYGALGSRYGLNTTVLGPNATDAEREAEEKARSEGKLCWGRECSLDDVLWPADRYDYDCDRWEASVPTSVLSFDPLPYDAGANDAKLSGTARDGNLCASRSTSPSGKEADPATFTSRCPSRRCLLTGTRSDGPDGGTVMTACCAWDTYVWLYDDPSIDKQAEPVRIPAFYVTMQEGSDLVHAVASAAAAPSSGKTTAVTAVMYARWKPEYNPSAALIWALGVFVAALAAWLSAAEYREEGRRVRAQNEIAEDMAKEFHAGNGFASNPSGIAGGGGDGAAIAVPADLVPAAGASAARGKAGAVAPGAGAGGEEGSEMRSRGRSRSPAKNGVGEIGAALVPRPSSQRRRPRASADDEPPPTRLYRREYSALSEEQMELTIYHALGFIVMASSALLILFFLKVYNLVKVMYGFGCSGALTQVLFYPLYSRLADVLGVRGSAERIAFTVRSCEIGSVSYIDIASGLSGYGLGMAWLYVAFAFVHPEESNFFWIVQDIMGACMCILFLNVIKLNSIRVASVLLVVAFLYDIFFVFITPLLTKGSKSIMITVATSGGPPKADPSWCEKYPRDNDCRGGDPLPMLLTVPRIEDYTGGSSLLGLGDIVLPGLLLSFAARFDEAKRLIGLLGGGGGVNRSSTCPYSAGAGAVGGNVRGKGGVLACFFFCCCCCSSLCNGGYFPPVVVSYAIGLLMANTAVYVMQMGQPALLYLVPCCLGTMVWLGWRRGELQELWHGPRVVRAADQLVYGEEGEGEGEGEDEDEEGAVRLAAAAATNGGGDYSRVDSDGGVEQRRLDGGSSVAAAAAAGEATDVFDEEGGASSNGKLS